MSDALRTWILAVSLATAFSARAETSRDYAIELGAKVKRDPPSIEIYWPVDNGALGYSVRRRLHGQREWSMALPLPKYVVRFVDKHVEPGKAYEYLVRKNGKSEKVSYRGHGLIRAAIDLQLVDDRGIVLLIVDATVAEPLKEEIVRLQRDLVGDGWHVIRKDVDRAAATRDVRAIISVEYAAAPTRVNSVFLLGHVPVPYSGSYFPDGHRDHDGAWPADVYYGDPTGAWTDMAVDQLIGIDAPRRKENRNRRFDGKLDHDKIPNDLKLAVGRVDFSDMPAFMPLTEVGLLRGYLDKDHAFRHRKNTAEMRALIDDNFGGFRGEAFASSGWRTFAPLVGAENVKRLDWFDDSAKGSYMWAYGCGAGGFQSANGIGDTKKFAAQGSQAVFTMLFGSYFGDWDSQNNLLRAPLAAKGLGLSCCWAGRPHWNFAPMGLGYTLGHCAMISQNEGRAVHMGLMGDPTLRMHVVAPPKNVAVEYLASGNYRVTWEPSSDPVIGYHVYAQEFNDRPFVCLTEKPVSGTSFEDPATVLHAVSDWMVRAVRLEETPSGSYMNASQGVFPRLNLTVKSLEEELP